MEFSTIDSHGVENRTDAVLCRLVLPDRMTVVEIESALILWDGKKA